MRGQDPGRYVVAGGSIAGLATALALARAGASVTVIERDPLPVAADAEAAFAVERPGAPQTHFLHAFLARTLLVLRERFPDVLAALEAAGARIERPPAPVDLGDGLGMVLSRRATFEWVLRRVIHDDPSVEVRTGTAVAGLRAAPARDGIPAVGGAVLEDGTVVPGTVIAACGRRGDVPGWLQPLGVDIVEELVESQLVYATRWYRVAEQGLPPVTLHDLGYLSYLAIPADGDTLAVAVAVDPSDRDLRRCLSDDGAFDRLVAMLPDVGPWVTDEKTTPLRPVRPMAGLVNRLRRFTGDGGRPLVAGFHAVGDAHTITNPAYGRGCSLALVTATLLADAHAAHPADPIARATAYEQACGREVEPWFHSAVMMDAVRQARLRGDVPDTAGGDLLRAVFLGAVTDPVVLSGFGRMMHLLTTPAELFADQEFTARLAQLAADPPELPAGPVAPDRDQVLAAATAA
ncbi:MAG: hypothetical protein JO148_16830 [Acidimicrobiia bacterium]|nr:hypothetical protein [Acidimicrobiia bacterium]